MLPLYAILLSKPVMNLGGLVAGSSVDWETCRSVTQEQGSLAKGENYLLHSVSVIWSIKLYTTRNWKLYPQYRALVPNTTPTWTWLYVGVRNLDGKPIYWDSAVKTLVDPQGNALPITPKGKRVFWDPEEERFEDLNGVALTSDELLDPRITPTPETWIDTNLLLVGVLLPSYENLFYNKTTQQLQLNDGTVVAALEDGTPIHYDDDAGVRSEEHTSELQSH